MPHRCPISTILVELVFEKRLRHIDALTHHVMFYAVVAATLVVGLYAAIKPSSDYSTALRALGGEPPSGPHFSSELHSRHLLADRYKQDNMWKSEIALAPFLFCYSHLGCLGEINSNAPRARSNSSPGQPEE